MKDIEKTEIIKEFRLYLDKVLSLNPRSRTNDVSWVKDLMTRHDIFSIQTMDDVNKMMKYEEFLMQQSDRTKYKKPRDLTNFKHAMSYFLSFILCWRVKEEIRKKEKSYDNLIDMIRLQNCPEHAKSIYEAIVFKAFQEGYVISEVQKKKMNESLSVFYNKQIYQNFESGSNSIVLNM